MNRNDQKSIGKLYIEAVLQGASGEGQNVGGMGNQSMTPDEALAAIKAKIGAPGGMPYDDFLELADIAFGANLKWGKLKKIATKALGEELQYNSGYQYDEDSPGYVFADIGHDYGQDEYTVPVKKP